MGSGPRIGRLSDPTNPDVAAFHVKKREIHRMLRTLERDSRALMRDFVVEAQP